MEGTCQHCLTLMEGRVQRLRAMGVSEWIYPLKSAPPPRGPEDMPFTVTVRKPQHLLEARNYIQDCQ